MIDMHSFEDWLRQIKGDTGKKKKSATARQCSVNVGGMGGGRGLIQKKKKKATKQKKQTVTQKERASTCTWIKGELNRDIKSLFNSDLERRGF